MIQSRTEREKVEELTLAPYAMHSSETRGRRYPESKSSRRMEYQRDRDRIINSKAFRRLEYKTQVFVNGTADHYRTRLTHTIEMSSVARTLARSLKGNEDLTASIALAHDIGHSPFGHAGERTLNRLMENHGGFDHNIQSLRWIDELEQAYPNFEGLNLTWEVRSGLMKHVSRKPGATLDGFAIGPYQSLEAQIADVADDITYQASDVEDGLDAGLITLEDLDKLELWNLAKERVLRDFPACPRERLGITTIRNLFSLQIQDVVDTANQRLLIHNPTSFQDIMNASERMVDFSPAFKALLNPFRDFLFQEMYRCPEVEQSNLEAVSRMEALFLFYIDHPHKIGRSFIPRIEKEGLHRTVCDYVSGCTDRYALAKCAEYNLV